MSNPFGILTIDLAAIQANYCLIQGKIGQNCLIGAVVKADAFGLGAREVTQTLIDKGCEHFFIANVQEALELRTYFKAINLYVLNGFYESLSSSYVDQNLIPVIGSFNEIKAYTKLGQVYGKKLPAFLHFNTRMNRLGFGTREQEDLWRDMGMLDGIDVKGVMSHLACADEPDHPMNALQNQLFSEIAVRFPGAKRALSNSSGIFCGTGFHYDMVRPGYALYGGNPVPGQLNPMKAVVDLRVPIIRTRILQPGAKIGYGATYECPQETQTAIVSAGYADGLPRSLSNRGKFYWHEYPCPVLGRVSMDLTCLDLSAIPKAERPKPGDYLEVLGRASNH